VRMDFSLLNQLVGIGTISITSSDETTRNGVLVMREVPQAEHRREEIRRLVDAARERRGVREIDMVHDDFTGGHGAR
ncbi:MAG: PH domain-containing protein, partial [Erythrobacter sp.]|nr:PH domain-containing protein [Erythrobacter sp.]